VKPSLWLEHLVHHALTEFMQFAYFTYFVYLLILGGILYCQRDFESYWAVMSYSAIGYVFGYVIAIFFPVQSPWFAMAGMWHSELTGGPFTALINLIEKCGRVHGAAFPSQHVAGAMAALWGAWRHRRWLFWVFLPFVGCMCVSTVYVRNHYVADVLGGLVTGTLGYVIGSWVMKTQGAAVEVKSPATNQSISCLQSAIWRATLGPGLCGGLNGEPPLRIMKLRPLTVTLQVFAAIVGCGMTLMWLRAQELSVPSNVSAYLPKQAVVRALVRLGRGDPERWFVAYDQSGLARIALVEGNMLTDDKAFETERSFGRKLSLQSMESISVPNADASFLLSFDQEGNKGAKYFCVVTFASGALDIKLFVSTVSGRAEVLDNPFRVRIWNKLPVPSGPNEYKVAEYRLPNRNATKLVKVQEETKTSE
jgi:membrane-associated phospholipid phosphatase